MPVAGSGRRSDVAAAGPPGRPVSARAAYPPVADQAGLVAAIEQSSDAIMVVGADRRITFVNRSLLAMSGFDERALLGGAPSLLFAAGNGPWSVLGAMEAGIAWSGSEAARTASGDTFEAEWSVTPTRAPDGALAGLVAVARDRTRERTLELQVARIQRLEALGQLAAGIAHDFNNVLSAVLGYAGILREPLEPDDPACADLDQITFAADRGAALVRQLVTFSRRQAVQPEIVDVNKVVSGVVPMLQRLLGEHVELASGLGRSIGRVLADPGQVEQVLVNLATNARDAMPGGGRLTIETSNVTLDDAYAAVHAGVRPGAYVLLAVSDTGCGMDAATLAHMFEPFFTTKGPEQGTGLGLATVHGIVNQAGGHVWAYSEVGRGTTFKVYLPRIADAPVATARPVAAPATGGSETILLVEDESTIRILMQRVLEHAGYRVIPAVNAHEALALPPDALASVDLLITDMVMPGVSGPELAAILLDRFAGIRVLCMSGYAEQSAAYQGFGGAVANFIAKPFAAPDLVRTVRSLLDEPSN